MTSLFVNTIGAYSGTVVMNFQSETTAALKITSTGAWRIEIRNPLTAPQFAGTAVGHGDNVVAYLGGAAIGAIHNSGGENFAVTEYSAAGSPNLLVNEIGAYDGNQPLSAGPTFIAVQSTGSWSIKASAQ